MEVKAFVLIEADIGKPPGEILEAAHKIEGVKSADSVAGPYDIVATVEVSDLDALGSLVKQLHATPGIRKTMTLIGMKF